MEHEKEIDESGTDEGMEKPSNNPDKTKSMDSLMGLMARMKALAQEIMESGDMDKMPEMMSIMSAMEITMKQMHSNGSHYKKD